MSGQKISRRASQEARSLLLFPGFCLSFFCWLRWSSRLFLESLDEMEEAKIPSASIFG